MAMPASAISHTRKRASDPPKQIAVATPAILPVPTMADMAVISALKGEMSLASSFFRWPRHIILKAKGMRRCAMKR